MPSSCLHPSRGPAALAGFFQEAKSYPSQQHPHRLSQASPFLPWLSPEALLSCPQLLCCSFSSKPLGVTGAGLVGPERGALEIGEEEGSWVMDPEKLWEAQGLWQQSWVLGLRTRLTSPGLELRFTALFLEGDFPTQSRGCQAS